MASHGLQRLCEPGHHRSSSAWIPREQLLQALTRKVLDDRKVGRAMSTVAIDETDCWNANAERVQPRVRGLEQIEPETGRERVGEVVVPLGRWPVVFGAVP